MENEITTNEIDNSFRYFILNPIRLHLFSVVAPAFLAACDRIGTPFGSNEIHADEKEQAITWARLL